jgi:uncharacterized membrane protein YciS (DUF1049 family)
MRSLRRIALIALVVALCVAGWSFAAANQQGVQVSWLVGGSDPVALWRVLVVSFGAGAIAVGSLLGLKLLQLSLLARSYRRNSERLEAELQALRNQSLAAEPTSESPAAVPPPQSANPIALS